MKQEAVFHSNTAEYIYPESRNQLIVRIRTARKEIRKCQIIYWNRTNVDQKKAGQMKCVQRDGVFDYFQIELTFSKIARYQKYYFCLTECNGEEWYYGVYGVTESEPEKECFEYLYANCNDVIVVPKWTEGVIYYQIFPDRFCNGSKDNDPIQCMEWGTAPSRENYMGGDLRGIIQKISYLKQLGVECLYLTPIFQGDFNHKYATTDYYKIDPMFGTNEEFKELVDLCHKQNIKVLLDGVFNHTGVHFPPFEDILKNQEQSQYRDWFFITDYPVKITHHDYECVGAYKWMPKLNTAHHEVRKYILEVMDYWIREYAIDGWRLDVSDEVDYSVWQEARLFLKEKYPQIVLIGETWGYGGRLLGGNQMDSIMNYMFRDIVRDYFALGNISEEMLDHRINHMLAVNKPVSNRVMYNLLDSHDTERFLFLCGEDKRKMKLAAAFQIFFPGSPAIYYGDEVGMTGGDDPDCRRCMIWDETADRDMLRWYRKLIHLRKENACIRKGGYHTIIADVEHNVYGFMRQCENEAAYFVFHKGEGNTEILCPVLRKAEYMDMLDEKLYEVTESKDNSVFLNEDIMEYEGYLRMNMAPYSVRVIKEKGGSNHEER